MRRLTPHLGNLLSANQFFDTLKRYDRQMPAVPFFRFIISEPAGEKPGWVMAWPCAAAHQPAG